MNKLFLFSATFFLLALSAAWAQDYPRTVIDGKEFYQYQPEKAEGFYALQRKFGVTQDEVLQYNPDLKDGIKLNQTILIPIKNTAETTPPVAIQPPIARLYQTSFIEHVVEKKETVYSISKQYDVAIDSIYKYNPEAQEKIKKGNTLRIPVFAEKAPEMVAEEPLDEPKNSVKVAFLLPFMLDAKKFDPTADKFFEFYQGALLAIDVLKKQGISIDVFTYDTDKTVKRIDSLLLQPELKTVDLLIGPAYTEQVKAVADFAKANKIRVVIPFSAKTEVTNNNEFVYQANTRQEVMDAEIASLFANTFKDKNIVFVKFNDGSQDNDIYNLAVNNLNANAVPHTTVALANDSIGLYAIDNDLKTDKENIVFLMTSNAATLAQITASLNKSTRSFALFGLQAWTQLKIQDAIFTKTTYIGTPFFVDYQEKATKNFFKKYTDNFGAESVRVTPHYNLLGYDITLYFVAGLAKFGNELENNLDKMGVETLQTRFKFEKISPAGGYMNKNIFLVRHRGDEKTKLK